MSWIYRTHIFQMMWTRKFQSICLINNAKSVEGKTRSNWMLRAHCNLSSFLENPVPQILLCVCQTKSDKRDYNASFKVIANVLIPSMWLITEKRVIKKKRVIMHYEDSTTRPHVSYRKCITKMHNYSILTRLFCSLRIIWDLSSKKRITRKCKWGAI